MESSSIWTNAPSVVPVGICLPVATNRVGSRTFADHVTGCVDDSRCGEEPQLVLEGVLLMAVSIVGRGEAIAGLSEYQ